MKFDEIIKDIKNKVYYPVYLIYGEETFFIDQISNYIEAHVLTDNEKEFNFSILYGRETSVQDILSIARRYPMMSNYQVVIVKEAQDLDKIDELTTYIEKPLKSTILVLCYKYKKPDKRKKFASLIEKHGVLFHSEKLKEDKIPAWINKYIINHKFNIDQICTQLLADCLGTDLTRITNELNKLFINLQEGAVIDKKIIESNIGINKDYNVFELQHCLAKRDIIKTNQIINHLSKYPKESPLIMTISILHDFFIRVIIVHQLKGQSDKDIAVAIEKGPYFLNEYKLATRNYSVSKLVSIISILREYDLKYKGVDFPTFDEVALHKEMFFKILH